MNVKDHKDNVKFYHIKEFLFCIKGLSISDDNLIKLIDINGGLTEYYDYLLPKYREYIKYRKLNSQK